jgi:hypothetical protein
LAAELARSRRAEAETVSDGGDAGAIYSKSEGRLVKIQRKLSAVSEDRGVTYESVMGTPPQVGGIEDDAGVDTDIIKACLILHGIKVNEKEAVLLRLRLVPIPDVAAVQILALRGTGLRSGPYRYPVLSSIKIETCTRTGTVHVPLLVF